MIHVLIIAVIDGCPQAPFVNKKFSEQILSLAVMSGLLFLSSIYTFPYEEFF